MIDDDKDILQLYNVIANSYGFHLDYTTKASDFIDLFNKGSYDIAFVDYLMPINGITLSRLLDKEKNINTKLYFLTSYSPEEVKRYINGDKYDGIISKDKTFSEIISYCTGEQKNGRN